VLGCSSRAQRAALSKRAGLWSSGVAAWAVASQGAFEPAAAPMMTRYETHDPKKKSSEAQSTSAATESCQGKAQRLTCGSHGAPRAGVRACGRAGVRACGRAGVRALLVAAARWKGTHAGAAREADVGVLPRGEAGLEEEVQRDIVEREDQHE
jgi:hypothetical protein